MFVSLFFLSKDTLFFLQAMNKIDIIQHKGLPKKYFPDSPFLSYNRIIRSINSNLLPMLDTD